MPKLADWKRSAPLLALWSLLILFFSTRTEVRGEPFIWIPITWAQALKISMAQWLAWGVLALAIISIDRRLPVRKDALVRRFLCHVPLSLVFTVAYTYLNYAILFVLDVPRDASLLAGGLLATSWRVIHRNSTFFYWVIVGTYIAVDYQNHLKDRLIRTAELERLLSEARLNALRTQLQPHFLFNALNAISAHVENDPRMARLMLERLGELLRLSLDHVDRQEIRLDQELAFVDKYLQLQAMRFEDRLTVSMNLDPDALEALVPPFILQPLVENAVRHGAAARSANGTITVDARRVNGSVHLAVRDNGPGLPAGWSVEHHEGIGLANTRERLRHLYGDGNQSLSISPQAEGGVRVDLSIPFRFS
ncbi:MAG: histidine kinase [Vicinamibacterales bacterium]|nr:histidine kinase [Vicinamibacterales bacterium]